jgi:hypothetical protein
MLLVYVLMDAGLTNSLTVLAPTVFMMCSRNCRMNTTRSRDGMAVGGLSEMVVWDVFS